MYIVTHTGDMQVETHMYTYTDICVGMCIDRQFKQSHNWSRLGFADDFGSTVEYELEGRIWKPLDT